MGGMARPPLTGSGPDLAKLYQDIEAKLDELERRLAETERLLHERLLPVEPVDGTVLPILRPRVSRGKKTKSA